MIEIKSELLTAIYFNMIDGKRTKETAQIISRILEIDGLKEQRRNAYQEWMRTREPDALERYTIFTEYIKEEQGMLEKDIKKYNAFL